MAVNRLQINIDLKPYRNNPYVAGKLLTNVMSYWGNLMAPGKIIHAQFLSEQGLWMGMTPEESQVPLSTPEKAREEPGCLYSAFQLRVREHADTERPDFHKYWNSCSKIRLLYEPLETVQGAWDIIDEED